MAQSNLEQVGKGLELLRAGLLPFAARELAARYKDQVWASGVEPHISNAVGLDARRAAGHVADKFNALDVQALLVVLWGTWNEVFHAKLGHAGRSYVSELREVRNKWAHQQAFTNDDTYRALDTMTRVLEMVSAKESEQTDAMRRDVRRRAAEDETRRDQKRVEATASGAAPALRPWREIITPHPDVASGRYTQAEFAADLSAVYAGVAEDEYKDPLEFFQRTYLTEGLTYLLRLAMQRLAGLGGDSVVDLQTNFGGGKTHSLLAVYHLFGGVLAPNQVAGLDKLMKEAGVSALPQAKRAVLVGQKINVATPQIKPDGTRVSTLWGEMAHQLGGAAGYKWVAEADQRGVNPGSETLRQLFDQHGPALILIDEWVAFLRNLVNQEGLPAGTFESNISFAQSLTEAANQSKAALVLVSLPQSDIEMGGPAGEAALGQLRQFVGRMAAVWQPVSANEGFEIVRRRLFQSVTNISARDHVCALFAKMYRDAKGEFPEDSAKAEYEQRLKSSYPIHPELFDRLYKDWSTLDQFQRTRGVLRLMAGVIHDLWEREDKNLLIMPGNLPMDNLNVRTELRRYLGDSWSAVIDNDIDGADSRPMNIDRSVPNLGRYSASRRVARTIFLGSAPSVAAQKVRGLETVRINLGCVQPGESAAIFGDALRRMSNELSYLFTDGNRYWYDVHRNIVREALDRAVQQAAEDVYAEIIRRLRTIKERGNFTGLHVGLPSSDIPDEQSARLVMLHPAHTFAKGNSAAHTEAKTILEWRGTAPRNFRNMLVFLAPDAKRAAELEQAARQYLAWSSISAQPQFLNMDQAQIKQAETQLKTANTTLEDRLKETYQWLLVPQQEGTAPITWDEVRISSGDDSIVQRASKKLESSGQLIPKWSATNLKVDLDRWLWNGQPHLSTKKLWEYLCSYPYLSRLKDESVLIEAIREGIRGREAFGYAARVNTQGTDDNRYEALSFGKAGATIYINADAVLVTPAAAARQQEAEAAKVREAESASDTVYATTLSSASAPTLGVREPAAGAQPQAAPRRIIRFFAATQLDPLRLSRDAGRISEEVVQHLLTLAGANVDITIEIQASALQGIPDNVVRTVSENCRTLKFRTHEFEE
jgi:hypothetical protein